MAKERKEKQRNETEEKEKQDRKKVSKLSQFGLGKEKDNFLENLTMLVDAGMDLLIALNALEDEASSQQMKKLIAIMREDIAAGLPLWRAMDRVNLLPPQLLFLVRIGEETGQLPKNLQVIVLQREKNKHLKSKIRSAMMYPVLVFGLMIIIGVGIAWFILPKLTGIFSQIDVELPVFTIWLIALGDFLSENGWWAVPSGFTIMGVVAYFVFLFPKTKFIGQAILFHVPVIKSIIRNIEIARFGFTLGSLLDAGLPITQALGSLSESTTFKAYRKFFKYTKKAVTSGASFQKVFDEYKKVDKIIPAHIQHMLVAGEQSGSLPKTLIRIGEKFELKVDEATANLSVLIEPVLLIFVWIGVMVIALAVIMPIYSLVGNIGGGG